MTFRSRVARLERHHLPRAPYVVRVNYPPTTRDAEAIAAARRNGQLFAVLPFKAGSVAEWQAKHEASR